MFPATEPSEVSGASHVPVTIEDTGSRGDLLGTRWENRASPLPLLHFYPEELERSSSPHRALH